jgi:hypothetical protein
MLCETVILSGFRFTLACIPRHSGIQAAKIAIVSGSISSRIYVPTGHRIPAQSNALGNMSGTCRVLKERRLFPNGRRVPDQPRLRRSFRTHEWVPTQTQGVALGWYASPIQGEPNVQTPGSPFQGESKCPNSSQPQRGCTPHRILHLRPWVNLRQYPNTEMLRYKPARGHRHCAPHHDPFVDANKRPQSLSEQYSGS